MKYIVIIPDGAADEPQPDHDGKTIFELAATPTMDLMAREGMLGRAQTVPEGMTAGSDVVICEADTATGGAKSCLSCSASSGSQT